MLVYFDLFMYPNVGTMVNVITNAGITVTGTSGTSTMTAVAGSDGVATFQGMPTGSVWTYTANGESATVTIDRLLQTITVGKTWIYGVEITKATSNPSDRVTYISDAAGFTPVTNDAGSFDMGSWAGNDLISGIAPISKSGTTRTYLDKKTLDGCPTSTSADALVEVPTWYLSLTNDDETGKQYIRFSNHKVDDTYQDYAGTFNGERVGAFWIGMFGGYVSSTSLYSYSGATPTVNKSITNFIAYAKARGDGYDIETYYQITYLTALLVLLFKSTNGQATLGKGLTSSGSAAQSRSKLAFANDYGMSGYPADATKPVAFFWIHDFWGNVYEFVGGAKTDASQRLMTIIDGYSSVTESDFTLVSPETPTGSRVGYVKDVVCTTEAGFLPRTTGASASSFWCDFSCVHASIFPRWGGGWSDGDGAGPFLWYFDYSASGTDSRIGSRLSYRSGFA